MDMYNIGDLVSVTFGSIPMIGTVVYFDDKAGKYLVRFNASQQMYYAAHELQAYHTPRKLK